MTTAIAKSLADHERTIERGMGTFIEVGQALTAIRDDRLYKADYSTFEDYCKDRWGWARNYVNKMIAATEVASSLGTTVPTPQSERHARPLTKLPAEDRADAWEEVVTESEQSGKPITANRVQEVVDRRTGEVLDDAEIVTTSTKRLKHTETHKVSHAMQFAAIAISQLERIRSDDPNRADALVSVRDWIDSNTEG